MTSQETFIEIFAKLKIKDQCRILPSFDSTVLCDGVGEYKISALMHCFWKDKLAALTPSKGRTFLNQSPLLEFILFYSYIYKRFLVFYIFTSIISNVKNLNLHGQFTPDFWAIKITSISNYHRETAKWQQLSTAWDTYPMYSN